MYEVRIAAKKHQNMTHSLFPSCSQDSITFPAASHTGATFEAILSSLEFDHCDISISGTCKTTEFDGTWPSRSAGSIGRSIKRDTVRLGDHKFNKELIRVYSSRYWA